MEWESSTRTKTVGDSLTIDNETKKTIVLKTIQELEFLETFIPGWWDGKVSQTINTKKRRIA